MTNGTDHVTGKQMAMLNWLIVQLSAVGTQCRYNAEETEAAELTFEY